MSLLVLGAAVPTTLDGPFTPATAPLNDRVFRGHAVDLPDSDPRVQRSVRGWEPEQVSVSLSAAADSVWISWITGLLLPLFVFAYSVARKPYVFMSV